MTSIEKPSAKVERAPKREVSCETQSINEIIVQIGALSPDEAVEKACRQLKDYSEQSRVDAALALCSSDDPLKRRVGARLFGAFRQV